MTATPTHTDEAGEIDKVLVKSGSKALGKPGALLIDLAMLLS